MVITWTRGTIRQSHVTRGLLAVLIFCLVPGGPSRAAEELDSIVAVVNDDVIVQSELEHQIALVIPEIQGRGTALPPRKDLERQVLDRGHHQHRLS